MRIHGDGVLHAWGDMGKLCSDWKNHAMCRRGARNGPCMDHVKGGGNVPATWRTPNKGESSNE